MARLDIKKYREDSEDFLSSLEKEYYLHFSGRKNTYEVEDIYRRSKLFNRENIDEIGKKLKERPQGKRYLYLLKFCIENFIESKTASIKEAVARDEASCRIEVDKRSVPLRYLEVLLSNEPDKVKRDGIEDKRNEKIEELLNPSLLRYWESLHRQAKHLGFNSYRDLFSYIKGEDFNETSEQMQELVAQTQNIYEKNFGLLMRQELELDFKGSRRSDLAYLKRAKGYDGFFGREYLIESFTDTLTQMGIGTRSQKNICFDVEQRENKSPRAFCAAVRIPQEIYLVIMPSGGQDDFEAFFHEGGHAQHFANVSPSLEFEYRCLGDNAVTEGFAFLMESLLGNIDWLTGFLGMDTHAAKSFTYFNALLKLWYCRRYAAKLKYELRLHDGSPIEGKQDDYVSILSESNLMSYDPETYLKDVDEGFYCTNYIRAWMFEAQFRQYLVKKFGSRWYSKKKAGDFLKEVWSYGQKYDVYEIISQLDHKMDVGYLIDSIKEIILSYKKL